MKILLIDNYDSFTYNLYHYLSSLKCKVENISNNLGDVKVSKDEIIENVAEKILTQEKSVAVIDENNKTVGSINPTKIINTVFGGRKNGK